MTDFRKLFIALAAAVLLVGVAYASVANVMNSQAVPAANNLTLANEQTQMVNGQMTANEDTPAVANTTWMNNDWMNLAAANIEANIGLPGNSGLTINSNLAASTGMNMAATTDYSLANDNDLTRQNNVATAWETATAKLPIQTKTGAAMA